MEVVVGGREALEVDPTGDVTHSPTVGFGEPPRLPALHGEPHESPRIMTTPVLVLAALAAVAGVINLPFQSFEFLNKWLEPVFEDVPEIHPNSFIGGFSLSALSVTVGLIGIFVAYSLYRRGLRSPAPWRRSWRCCSPTTASQRRSTAPRQSRR